MLSRETVKGIIVETLFWSKGVQATDFMSPFLSYARRNNYNEGDILSHDIMGCVHELIAEQKIVAVKYRIVPTEGIRMFLLPPGSEIHS